MPTEFETVAAETPDKMPVYTDAPWYVAWYGERPAVWLPQMESDRIGVEKVIPMQVVLLTSLLDSYTQDEGMEEWVGRKHGFGWPKGYVVARPFLDEKHVALVGVIVARPGIFKPLPGGAPGASTAPATPPAGTEGGGGSTP